MSEPLPSGEKLFEFVFENDQWRCELRDHGAWGVEAQFFKNDALVAARRLESRTLAEGWAWTHRATIEYGQ